MQLSDVSSLPPTLSTEQAAEVFGVSVDHLWGLVRIGAAPVEPLKLGKRLRWPTARVLAAVGLDVGDSAESSAAPVVPLRGGR